MKAFIKEKGVPEKTVVLIFDPGLRRTYRTGSAPLLETRH